LGPIPNPQSPIPNTQNPFNKNLFYKKFFIFLNLITNIE